MNTTPSTPEKSREIDLRRFVPLEQIDPMYFDRAYFLVPDKEAPKAYRLLAQSLENMGRAGIATFVMRGKEYLVAIIAEGGVLRAETLRFEDELRIAIEERASLSPDALTGMEASLRFPGPETMETKIFARLSAWQNWIFTRPNATGAHGALTLYGQPERAHFDWKRT